MHVERERQTILVPVHHIRCHRSLLRRYLRLADSGRGETGARDKSEQHDRRTHASAAHGCCRTTS